MRYKEAADRIPWASFGRDTPISQLARSLVAVGNFPKAMPDQLIGKIFGSNRDPDFESKLLEIEGTAFYTGSAKFATCWHVCKELKVREGLAHVIATSVQGRKLVSVHSPIASKMSYVDPRTENGNKDVDLGLLVGLVDKIAGFEFEVPPVKWADSSLIGVGDRVLIGGFPLGTKLFTVLSSNRGLVQPTFVDGIVSAILPATKATETRLFQLSSVCPGGFSGGVVCNPENGEVIGMITSGVSCDGADLPITYAIPSEIIRPYVEATSFKLDGKQTD